MVLGAWCVVLGRLLNTWNVIVVKHPGYHAWSTYEQVKEALRPHLAKAGSYVFRLSVTRSVFLTHTLT